MNLLSGCGSLQVVCVNDVRMNITDNTEKTGQAYTLTAQ